MSKLIKKPWAKAARCLPNELCRFAIFSLGTSKQREIWDLDNPLNVVRIDGEETKLELTYAGKELRQDDLDVYLELLHYARDADISKELSFKRADLMKSLGQPQQSFYYDRLLSSMRRLSNANIEGLITRKSNGVVIHHRFNFNLVDSFQYKEFNGEMARQWKYRLPPELIEFFTENGFARIDHKRRQALKNNQIAKWLQMYFASHRKNNTYAIKVETLMELCGSNSHNIRSFRQKVAIALKLLKATGIADAYIDKETDRIMRK